MKNLTEILGLMRAVDDTPIYAEAVTLRDDAQRVERFLRIGDSAALERDDGIFFTTGPSGSVTRNRGRILERGPQMRLPLGQIDALLTPSRMFIWNLVDDDHQIDPDPAAAEIGELTTRFVLVDGDGSEGGWLIVENVSGHILELWRESEHTRLTLRRNDVPEATPIDFTSKSSMTTLLTAVGCKFGTEKR